MYYEIYKDFFEKVDTKIGTGEVRNIITQYIAWKQNVWAALWKEDFYKDDRCPKCGDSNLIHHPVYWEGRKDGWAICPSIWKTDCPDCKTSFICVSNDDGELLNYWRQKMDEK